MDHTIGYPDLIFTPWVIGRKVPLEVFGPPGIRAMTDHLLAAWADDIKIRNGPIERDLPEHSVDGYRVNAHEISAGVVHKDGNLTVTAFNVNHGNGVHAHLAIVFRLPTGRSSSQAIPALAKASSKPAMAATF